MDYGEELAYWYLRLNGFFPLKNFVVHRSPRVTHRSDVDLLAVRPPYVFEEVGGRTDDWDEYLTKQLPFDHSLGILCEVKTGAFEKNKLFRVEYVRYAFPRLGLAPAANCDNLVRKLLTTTSVPLPDGGCVAKLLISQERTDGPYLNRTLSDIKDFIEARIQRYSLEKYAARMFFPSELLQYVIDEVNAALRTKKQA
jgi:hypothetical protein